MQIVRSGLLRRARLGYGQLVSPGRVFAFKVVKIEHHGQDVFILVYLSEDPARLSHLVRAESAQEETWNIAE